MGTIRHSTHIGAGFRHLRPIIQERLSQDLAAPTAEYTKAFADLTLAFGFARVGAVDDARRCADDAQFSLSTSTHEGHHWLLRVYRHWIQEALHGRPHGGFVPAEVDRPSRDELQRRAGGEVLAPVLLQGFVFDRLRSISRILDPEASSVDLQSWTTHGDKRAQTLLQLRTIREAKDAEAGIWNFVQGLVGLKADALLWYWRDVLPLARRASSELAIRLSMVNVPDLMPARRGDHSDWFRHPLNILTSALEVAAGQSGAEPFPPLIDAACHLAEIATPEERLKILASVSWPCLRWFRNLNCADECADFLYRTRDFWPPGAALGGIAETPSEQRQSVLSALVARASFEVGCGNGQRLRDVLDLTARLLTDPPERSPWHPKDVVLTTISYVRGAAFGTDLDEAISRIGAVLSRFPTVPDTWSTREYYARDYIQIVEATVLAFPIVGEF